MEAAHIAWRPLGRLLVEQGLLTDDELERALARQQTTGRRLGETIVELGFVSNPDLASTLATQYGIELTMETGFGTGLRAQIQRRHENDRRMPGLPVLNVVDTPQAEPEPGPPADVGEQPDAGEALLLTQLEEQWAKLAAAEASLEESERKIAALTHAADRRRQQATRFVDRVRDRNRQLEEQQDQFDQLARTSADQLADRERKLAELTHAVDHRRRQATRFVQRVRDRERQLQAQQDELRELGLTTADQLEQIERLAGDVRGCDAEIERLRYANGRLRAQAGRFVTRLRHGRGQPDHRSTRVPVPSSHLVFVQLDGGYELVESDGPAPALNTVLELPQLCENELVVTRLGRSPLPADPRACVFVQRA